MSVTRNTTDIINYRPDLKDFGTCLSFDGVNDIVTYGNANPFSGPFYVSMWVKWNGLNGGFQTLFAKRDSYAANGLMFSMSLNSATGTINLDTVTSFVPWSITIKQRVWTHICWVHDTVNNQELLYINGSLVSTQGGATLGTKTNALISIGACEATPVDSFFGLIDEVAIGTSAPSASEVLAMMKKYNYPSRWSYSKYDEGSGTTALDSSGNGNVGTLNGPTYTTDKILTTRPSVTNRFVLKPAEQCLFFGGDTYLTLPFTPSSTFSMMFWYNSRDNGANFLVNWQENFNSKGFFVRTGTGGVLDLYTFVNGTPQTITTAVTGNSKWRHCLFVVTSGTCRIFIDGVQVSSGVMSAYTTVSGKNLTIGRYSFFNGGYVMGKMKDLLFKNGVLWGATEAQNHMYRRIIPASPTCFLKLNGDVLDSSGNGNNGTLTIGSGSYPSCDIPMYGQRVAA